MRKICSQRIGEISTNTKGSLMEVIEYNNQYDILVKFLDHGYIVRTRWDIFKKGLIRNPYDKTVYNIGFLGVGNYKASENNITTPAYQSWQRMFMRCYSNNYQMRNPTYQGCTVAEEWYNFQNFAKWFDENYYEVEGEQMHLDKDILVKGNKVYSSVSCIFVPKRINSLFIKSATSQRLLPTGVSLVDKTKKYISQCDNGNNKRVFLGEYDTPQEAFLAYKIFKENLIKNVAEEYQNKIPFKLYDAMLNYKIEW